MKKKIKIEVQIFVYREKWVLSWLASPNKKKKKSDGPKKSYRGHHEMFWGPIGHHMAIFRGGPKLA